MRFATAKRPLASAALIGLLGLAGAPAGAGDGKGMAYVTNQDGDVTVIDLATLETVAELDVGAEGPRGLGVTADGALLVTANGEVVVVGGLNRLEIWAPSAWEPYRGRMENEPEALAEQLQDLGI